jgi:REP element-mobilizing transposase RayT
MWNDRDTPLAYVITFRTYGTWLHGDERGSTDRHNNIYRTPHIASMRSVVEKTIRETCSFRHWHLYAINVRTNHAHSVISAARKPELVLNALKANSTRELKQLQLWTSHRSPWAEKGSCRHLWNEQSVARAIEYVVNGQGGDLPRLD